MVLGAHAKTRAMYSTPPWPSLAASAAAYRRRSFSDNYPKKRCIFSSISAAYPSMLSSLSQNLLWRKDTTAQACREVILDHILSCSGLQTVARGLANKGRFQLTFCANTGPRQPTVAANEPTVAANSPQTVP